MIKRIKNKPMMFGEFVTLLALLMSLTALAIDAMLPALSIIGKDLHVNHANDVQLIISMVFFGISVGMVFYGPFSDSYGRKPAIYLGLAIFIIGCVISLLATNLETMLIGRFLQGLGVASPRTVVMALVRDKFEGRMMAQVMSFAMTIFIFIPAIAPLLGQGVLAYMTWHGIFIVFIVITVLTCLWFFLRLEETLPVENRLPFCHRAVAQGVKEVLSYKTSVGYTLILSSIMGIFVGFLSSVEQIFHELYHTGEKFPFYFALLALSLGLASFINGKIVLRFGSRRLGNIGMLLLSFFSLLFLPLAYAYQGVPPLVMVMVYFSLTFFSIGMLFGNLNAMAMEPLGHIAGIGAALIGATSTLFALPIGILIGQLYDASVLPLVWGFLLMGLFSLWMMRRIESGKLPTK